MSGGLALLRALCQWKIEHQMSRPTAHSLLVTTGVAKGATHQKISSIFNHFVLWQAMSWTKYYCSLNSKSICYPLKQWYSNVLARGPHLSFRNPSRATSVNNLNKNSLKNSFKWLKFYVFFPIKITSRTTTEGLVGNGLSTTALKCWAGYATACNHFHSDGLHLSRSAIFLSIKPFTQHFLTWCSVFLWQKARKTARHSRTPMNSSIVILMLRSK